MNSARLLHSWLTAEYCVPTTGCVLRIGAPAPAVEAAHGEATHFSILTAWNAGGRGVDLETNLAAEVSLDKALDAEGLRFVTALNRAAGGGFEEPARLLLDARPGLLDSLARRFGQAGSVSWSRGEPLRMRIYRPEWRQRVDAARMDTRFIDWVAFAPP